MKKKMGVAVLLGVVLCASAGFGADELFGMNLQPQLVSRQEEAFARMETLGVRWVRTNAHWGLLEPQPGKFDWTQFDAQVAAAERHHLKLLVTIRAISPWASTQMDSPQRGGYHATYPPKSMEQYAAFVRTLVGRYRGKGMAWQIENEPNGKGFWGGTREEYITLLKAGYKAAHAADEKAMVLPAGLACAFKFLGETDRKRESWKQWFDAILDSGAFDAIDLHNYYPPEANNAWGMTFEEYLATFEGWMKARKVNVPVWISEAGVNSRAIQVGGRNIEFTPEQQARDLEQIYAIARKHGVAHVFWLKLVDTPEAIFSYMGLGSTPKQDKPAAAVYRRLAGE